MKHLTLTVLCIGLALSGCAPASVAPANTAAPALPSTATITPAPTLTPTITLLPNTHTPTVTFTPTAIPNPMSIEALRAGYYPGSEITIVKELNKGANYRRYYAYYLSEELKIYALLTVPDGDMPVGGWPAIVFNHGYIPPDQYRTTERYVAYVDQIARAGYIVFRIDYRGNDRSEGQPTGAYGGPGYTIDVLNAVASIKQFPQANPNKIGMWGHSMGGFLTLRAMVISPDIKVGVIWAGVVGDYNDLLYNWPHTGSSASSPSSHGAGWRDEWIAQYGPPTQNPAFWDSVSANSYLNDLSGPLQLHHGTADTEVPLAFSQTLAIHLNTLHLPYEFYIYEGDNHNISINFKLAMDRTIAFFDKYLK
jgi:dipeptidyl aminopeptidase/acylaminoacyl peptidase